MLQSMPRLRIARLVTIVCMMQATLAQEEHDEEEEVEPFVTILFPWFSQILGIAVFFILTRYLTAIPFTAVMFLLGTFMGIGSSKLGNVNQLSESIVIWTGINSEVLLLVFLPGLIFNDAFSLDVHLFSVAFPQLFMFAFPMVLAGTCLTALVGFYIFPYSWSWNLSMTFGSILAATDPVAVNALLNEVGAPPRLKIHISGESLLNDGSAYVFFTIFSALFLTELGIPGVGEEIDIAGGFALFFRLALGGAAIGIIFGLGLVGILYSLNRRLIQEENVLQITATITVAYLTYYTGDIAGTSGLIATVFCGITAKELGNSMINDHQMMKSFWILVEHLLNTLLFALAGVLWGDIISDAQGREIFVAKDWGYLILLFLLVNVIRFFLVGAFYPITSHVGLGSNWQESTFMAYGGLRGAVGIALAISLNSEVGEAAEGSDADVTATQTHTLQLYAMVGGVTFLTLLLNGSSAGPLLIKLGLAASSATRLKLLHDFERTADIHMEDEFVKLLSEPRFHNVDFAVVKSHVKDFEKMTLEELKQAVLRNPDYSPNLENVIPYFLEDTNGDDLDLSWAAPPPKEETKKRRKSVIWEGHDDDIVKSDRVEMDAVELRKFFLEILRAVYSKMIESGMLDGRDAFVTYVLLNSIEFALEAVGKGEPLKDWEAAQMLGNGTAKDLAKVAIAPISFDKIFNRRVGDDRAYTLEYQGLRVDVARALAFIQGHGAAKKYFCGQFDEASGQFTDSEKVVAEESDAQVEMAKQVLESTNKADLQSIESHAFCSILLNKKARYTEKLLNHGILTDREVGHYLEEIQEALEFTHYCSHHDHPGQLSPEVKEKKFSQATSSMSSEKPEAPANTGND